MSNARDYDGAKELSPEQRLMAAHLHIVSGVAQHTIAGAMGVNSGRVAEAISAIKFAMAEPRKLIRLVAEDRVRETENQPPSPADMSDVTRAMDDLLDETGTP